MSKLLLSYLFKTSLASFRSAILKDDTDAICRILDIERDYMKKDIDSQGNTALLLAIQYASPLTVRLLLEQGAHPDQPNSITLQTPLCLLASKVYEDYKSYKAQKTFEMAKILLDNGAFIDKPSPRHYTNDDDEDYSGKETPSMTAVRKQNLPMITLFIERKANVNYLERQSQIRPIHYAITNGDESVFDLLENAGAVCHAVITIGENNLLHWFCATKENDKHIPLLEKLIAKGYDVNKENSDQYTPLMLAVKDDMINTCRVLLNAQAEIDNVDCKGNQAIDLAKQGSECSKLLRQKLEVKSKNNPSTAVIWRKRVDFSRRSTSELSDLKHGDTSSPCTSSKYSDAGETIEGQNNGSPIHPYIYPNRRRDSDEMDTKYERMWEKLLHTRQKRRAAKRLSQQRAHPAGIEDGAPL